MKTCEITGQGEPCNDQLENIEEILDKIPEDEELQYKSEYFKALSDPTRLKILYLLQHGELCVCEINTAIEKPQSTTSHHLNVLKSAGLIKGRKDGVWIHYKLTNQEIVGLLEELTQSN
jgi:DNA-binding transcriptional ArsR family regulator